MTRLFLAILGVLLVTLALPRFMAYVSLAPGVPATRLVLEGARLTPEGYARAIRAHERALSWLDHGRIRAELGSLLLLRAMRENDLEYLLDWERGKAEALQGLAREPVNDTAWLVLAQAAAEEGDRETLLAALHWAVRSDPYDPDNAHIRIGLALPVWEQLDLRTRAALEADLAALLRRDAVALARALAAVGRLYLLELVVDARPELREAYERALARLAVEPSPLADSGSS